MTIDIFEFIDPTYYQLFDYLRQVKIDSRQINQDYGNRAAFTLNYRCPVVVKRGGQALDELAADHGFEGTDDLYYHIMNYKPKYQVLQEVIDYYESESL